MELELNSVTDASSDVGRHECELSIVAHGDSVSDGVSSGGRS